MQGCAGRKGLHSLSKAVRATNEITSQERGLAGMEVLKPGYDCIEAEKALSPGVWLPAALPPRPEAGSEDSVAPCQL